MCSSVLSAASQQTFAIGWKAKPGWPMNVTGCAMAAAEAAAPAVATCGSSLNIFDDATDGRTCGAAGNISR